jgi:predicted transglutaminase-like cysteine proteinase
MADWVAGDSRSWFASYCSPGCFRRRHLLKGRASLHGTIFVTVFAIGTGLAVPIKADDRPSDPFGNHTADLKNEEPIVKMWDLLRNEMMIEKGYFHRCLETKDCPSIPELAQKLNEVRQYQGKALLGHLNMSINFMIKPAPTFWTTPLEAITMRNGDCKSYSIAKYAGVQELGIAADHVRLVIVHIPRRSEDHMITAVYQEGEWFLLDNLTNFLVRDFERKDYEPLAVLDYKGVRRYLSAFWVD